MGMKNMNRMGIVVCLVLTALFSCDRKDNEPEGFQVIKYDPVDVIKENSILIYVHYMPWFEDRNSSADGQWGMHWTMETQNPDIVDSSGKRQIASHFYPLIGPYASSDPDVIEYHLLLMKYSGIDGLLFDWYGSSDLYDYPAIRENTELLVQRLDEVGLKFGIVYEDRTVSAALDQDPALDRIAAAQDDMMYIEDQYYNNSSYILIDDKPLFLVFGPEEFHDPDDWSDILSVFYHEPLFLVLNGKSSETSPASSGEYIWVDNTSLENKYSTMNNFQYFMGGAYPGFLDFYEEGGWGEGFDWQIDHNGGTTFQENLLLAQNYGIDYLQLITWNDFGEGTMIEPTLEFGFGMLELLQEFAGVGFSAYELEKIHTQYTLRKYFARDTERQKVLNQSFYYFVSLQTEKAIALVDSLDALTVE
jgi:hypothetical protein